MVEGTGLENRQAGDRLVGSNPTSSASQNWTFGTYTRRSEYRNDLNIMRWRLKPRDAPFSA